MNIHEYQAKALLAKFAVPLLKGGVAYTRDEAMDVARKRLFYELLVRLGSRRRSMPVVAAKAASRTIPTARAACESRNQSRKWAPMPPPCWATTW